MAEMFMRFPDGKEVVFPREGEPVVLKPVEPIILSLKCRICKKLKPHKVILEFGDMPKGLACVECYGCGVVGIEKVPENDTPSDLRL